MTTHSASSAPSQPPFLFVIFGATGDLTARKLLPAILRLVARGDLPARFPILGVARDDLDDDRFRQLMIERLRQHAHEQSSPEEAGLDLDAWCRDCLYYQAQPDDSAASYRALRERIERLEQQLGTPGNRIFYLALPPVAFPTVITALGEQQLQNSPGWTRLVIEKPFGTDLDSARALNELVHRYFREEQIYRIDHYLGKETVQNLLAFRFANPLFEHAWNRDRIERVEITVAESLGVGHRAGYYDRAGALRDMVQNHLMQLLATIAMEVPAAFRADAIRYEKIKVVNTLAPLRPDDVIYGQYTAGRLGDEAVPGYREEPGVPPDSTTPTFVALRLAIENWRWQSVPFYLRTGKRLPKKHTEIAVLFRAPPTAIFQPHQEVCEPHGDILHLMLEPDEGFDLEFDVKVPGGNFELRKQHLAFRYADVFPRLPEAYETLIQDIFEGDQTLFVHAEMAEASWRLLDPILQAPPPTHPYPAGSWGPPEVAALLPADDWVSRGAATKEHAA